VARVPAASSQEPLRAYAMWQEPAMEGTTRCRLEVRLLWSATPLSSDEGRKLPMLVHSSDRRTDAQEHVGLVLGRAHRVAHTGPHETTATGRLTQPDSATSPVRERVSLGVSHRTVGDFDNLHRHRVWTAQLVEGWVLTRKGPRWRS
jgi:hypothetical protein